MQRFSDSVLIIAPSAKRLLCPTPTDKNTARPAAERFTESRKTRAQESAERTVRGVEMPCLQGLFLSRIGAVRVNILKPPISAF